MSEGYNRDDMIQNICKILNIKFTGETEEEKKQFIDEHLDDFQFLMDHFVIMEVK